MKSIFFNMILQHGLRIALTALTALLSACSGSQLKVDSQPPAVDVAIVVAGQPARKLGQTPLNLTETSLGAQGEPFQLIISKDGFYTENVLIGPSLPSRTTEIKIALKTLPVETKGVDEAVLQRLAQTQRAVVADEVLQRVASGVALTLRFLSVKQYDQAEQNLSSLISQHPSVPTLQELMGNIHYLRKDLPKALTFYRKALELNPSNFETQRMVNKIESIRGDRVPASQGGR